MRSSSQLTPEIVAPFAPAPGATSVPPCAEPAVAASPRAACSHLSARPPRNPTSPPQGARSTAVRVGLVGFVSALVFMAPQFARSASLNASDNEETR